MVKRKVFLSLYPTLEIQFDGTTFTQITKTSLNTDSVTFKLGETFEKTFEATGKTMKVCVKKLLFGSLSAKRVIHNQRISFTFNRLIFS